MSRYKVYSKDGGAERCVLTKIEYSGTFMGDRVVTSTLVSATEIAFDVFDYIEFRGERFELEMMPTVKKVSSFQYEYELRFVSLKYELERCIFRDIVPNDNEVVYPTPLTVEFTGDFTYLTERIQACLDRMYGDGVWSIVVEDGVESEEKNLSLSNQNCWNALSLVNTEFGLNFYIEGRTITIGESVAIADVTFKYGKGNGLYEIERVADSDTGVVTKLIVYGGTKNLDYSYPKKPEWSDSVLDNTFVLSPLRLMLPSFKIDGKTDYILAGDEQIAKYGIREGVITYDDIFPTITGVTNSNGERIDQIRAVEPITDEESSTFVVHLYDLGFDLNDSLTTETAQVSMKTGTLQGYTFNIKEIENNANGGVKLTLERGTLEQTDTGNFYVPNGNWNMKAGDEFVLLGILMPQTYIRKAEERLLERAKEYLAQYSSTNYSYNIGVDEIFMARNGSVMDELLEGKQMKISDDEIGISDELVTIQQLTIEDGDGSIPRIKVTLNNNPSASTLERIQGQINSIESTTNTTFSAQSELAKQYQRKLNSAFFYKLFTPIDANGVDIAPNDMTRTIASIRANYGLWTEYFLSAKGRNPSTGSSTGGDGASTLGGLNNVADGADVGEEGYDVAKMLVLEANSNLWTLKNLSELVGLDEDALAEYLTNNNYAKKSDIPSLTGYATESWVLDKGYATTSDLDARIDALVNGAPAAYDTLKEIADVLGKNVDSIADILDALGTKANKVDVDAAISAVNASISALNTELSGKIDLKLDAATFNELFEKVLLEDGKTYAIRAKLGLFSDSFLSAKGANASGGSSTGGAGALYQLADVAADGQQVSGAAIGALLMYNGTKWQGVAQSEIVPNLTGYAKLTDIPTTFAWDKVTGKPATLSGYGITDAYTSSQIDTKLGGYLPLSGGTITNTSGDLFCINRTSGNPQIRFEANGGLLGYIGFTSGNAVVRLDSTYYNIIHSGNIGSQSVASAAKLTTSRKIWGQSFDGTGDVSGNLILGYNKIYLVDGSNSYYVGWNSNSQLVIQNYYDIIFNTSTERVRITNGGNVGIGTDNPQYKLDVNGTTRTTKLVIGNGSIEWDETNKGFKIVGGLYTESYLSAKGANTNGGSSSGGLITSLYRYADLGKTFADTSNDTFNAYTINKINTDLGNRISVLEGKATNVSFTQSLTSGTQIGTITIDGASKNIYAPTIPTSDINKGVTAYGWGNHANVGYAMASALSGYQTKITSSNKLDYSLISGVPTKLSQFTNDLGLGTFAYKSSLAFADLTGKPTTLSGYGITDAYTKSQVDSALGGYLPLSGGTLTGALVTVSSKYGYEGNYGLNMNNSDIVGANAIYFGDTSNSNQEGLHFIRSNGNYDTLRAMDGVLMFATNIATASQLTSNVYNTVYHTGNLTKSSIGLGNVDNTSDSNKNVNSSVRLRSMYGIDTSDNMSGRPTTANLTFTDKSLRYFLATASMTEGKPPTDSCVLHLAWDNTAWGRQIAVGLGGMYYRYQNEDTSWNGWKQIALTDSNVASATKLATSRKLWGQSFNGENDVNGHLSIGTILGQVAANRAELSIVSETDVPCDLWLGNSAENVWSINCRPSNENRSFSIFHGSLGHLFRIDGASGNVGIGTTSPQYKLDVLGGGLFTDSTNTYGVIIGNNNVIDGYTKGTNSANLYINRYTKGNVYIAMGGGYVGVGTNSPQYILDVNGTLHANNTVTFDNALKVGGVTSIGAAQGQYDAYRAQLSVISTANQPAMFWLGSSGEKKWSVEGRGEADSYRFSLYSWVAAKHILKIEHSGVATLDGTFNATTGIWSDGYVSAKGQNTSSDIRLKNVLGDVELGVSAIANAPSVRFEWKNGGGVDVGSSAQYWQGLLPDAVKERDGMLEMQYANIALLSAIAIAKRVETHEERIERLEREVKELRIEN